MRKGWRGTQESQAAPAGAGLGRGQWCHTEESGAIAPPSPTAPEQDPTFLGLPHASGRCFHGP